MKRFLIKYATRGRKDKFYAGLNNILDTISRKHAFEIIVSIDSDDSVMMNEVENIAMQEATSVYFAAPNGKIGAINRDIEKARPWDILVNFSDDMRFAMS